MTYKYKKDTKAICTVCGRKYICEVYRGNVPPDPTLLRKITKMSRKSPCPDCTLKKIENLYKGMNNNQ